MSGDREVPMHIISPVIVKKPLPITENRATQVVALLQDDNNGENKPHLQLPSFVVPKENGLFVNIENIENRDVFLRFIDYIFHEGYFFVNTNYTGINKILYDFENTKKMFSSSINGTGKIPEIQIASRIQTFDTKRIPLYKEPKIAANKKSAEYFFGPVYGEEINTDEFIGAMWKYGIRFGLDIKNIGNLIREAQIVRYTIAIEQEPTSGSDAYMEPVISFDIKLGAKDTANHIVDMLQYEQSFVQVEANVPIYKKVSRILGRSGWSIDGTHIDPKIPMDITAQSFVGQGVYTKIWDDGIEYILSIESGFPRLETSSYKKDGKLIEKLDKIHVDEVKHFEKGIGMLTGKVSTDNDIDSQADIVFDTEGKSIFAQKNVEANLHAINDITIKGNVYGSSDSHVFHKTHQKLGLVRKGQIVSENGDITIHGHANNTYLEAKNGTVKVSNVTNSIIFGKRVEIGKGVSNCIIVAEEIVSNGKMYGCSLISMKSMDLAQSTEKGDFENTISLFSLDLSESLQKKEQERQKGEKDIVVMENKIDEFIRSRFPLNILERLPHKEKRFALITILMNMLENPRIISGEQYKPYIPLWNQLKPTLEKMSTIWRQFTEKKLSLVALFADILAETTTLENSTGDFHIHIQNIQAPTYIRWVKSGQNKPLFDLTIEEIEHIATLIPGEDPKKLYKIENIPAPKNGVFDWKPSKI